MGEDCHVLDLEGEVVVVDDDTVGEGELLVGTLGNPHHLQQVIGH